MDKKNIKKKDEDEIEEAEGVAEEKEGLEPEENSEVEELQQKVADIENQFKRAVADYQNLERRVRDERLELIRSANREMLLRILPVLDTLIMAVQHSKDQSLQVSVAQFLDILKSEGVVRIETIGKVFDPHLMEVVSTTQGDENKVIQEMRSGYLLNEKLLRPAQVVVGEELKN